MHGDNHARSLCLDDGMHGRDCINQNDDMQDNDDSTLCLEMTACMAMIAQFVLR